MTGFQMKGEQGAASHRKKKASSGREKNSNAKEEATSSRRWRHFTHLEKWLLRTGGLIGAVVAVVTVPTAVHGIWKGWNEGWDRLTPPTISASANNFSIRCVVQRLEGEQLKLDQHCLSKQLGVSSLLTFQNLDFVPRSFKQLTASLVLFGSDGKKMEFTLDNARFANHEERNGLQELVLSSWTSIDLAPNSSETHELLFTSKKFGKYIYSEFQSEMFEPNVGNKWSKAKLQISAEFNSGDEKPVFECENVFSENSLNRRRGKTTSHLRAQIQIPVTCTS